MRVYGVARAYERRCLIGTKAYIRTAEDLFGVVRIGAERILAGIFQAQVVSDLVQHLYRGDLALHGKSGEQKVIEDGVDQAWDSLRTEVNFIQQARAHDGLIFQAGAGHTGTHVSQGFFFDEAAQGTAQGNPLFELAEFGRLQLSVQFLLSGQNDLQQFAAAILQIAEEPDLLQNIPFQVVGFVDDEDGGAPGAGAFQQHVIQGEQNLGLGEAVAAQVKIVSQEFEELFDGEAGVEEGSEGNLLGVEEIAQTLQHGGLAGADLAGKGDESLTALHAVDEAGESFFVLRTPEEKRRVGTHVERVLGEAEEGVIHDHPMPAERSRLSRDGTPRILTCGLMGNATVPYLVPRAALRKPWEGRGCSAFRFVHI